MRSYSVLLFGYVALFLPLARAQGGDVAPVRCDGSYKLHLQGVCADDSAFYWCFTDDLVKTDRAGTILARIAVKSHHGDLCLQGGKIYVAVNFGKFNQSAGQADSWVYVYAAADLVLVAKYRVPELMYGAGGIAWHGDKFFVVGGLPPDLTENYVYEYDEQFHFIVRHAVKSGNTFKGIQTVAFADGRWWFGCYADTLLTTDERFENVERFQFDCALGIVPVDDGKFLIARGGVSDAKMRTGRLIPAESHSTSGLIVRKP